MQPSWAGAPSLEGSTLLIPGTPALGLRESSPHGQQDSRAARRNLKATLARRRCLLLTALTTPTQILLLQLHSALRDLQSKRNS